MSELKLQQMHKACSKNLDSTLQSVIIDLVEEGYTEQDIKIFLKEKMEESLKFLEQYVAL